MTYLFLLLRKFTQSEVRSVFQKAHSGGYRQITWAGQGSCKKNGQKRLNQDRGIRGVSGLSDMFK